MRWHPFAERFPMLEGDEWESFKASINKTKGNELKVYFRKLPDGSKQGLDGRNRFRACEQLSIKCAMEEVFIPDDEVKDFIIRKNIYRRHLEPYVRRDLVQDLRSDGKSERQISMALKVPKTTVHRDIETINNGTSNDNETRGPNGPPVESKPLPSIVTGIDGKQYDAKKAKQPKPGKPKFDDAKITEHIRKFVQLIDDRAKAYGKTAAFKDMETKLEAVANSWKRWRLEKEK